MTESIMDCKIKYIMNRIRFTLDYNFRADIVSKGKVYLNNSHTRIKFLIDIFSKCLCRLVARCANAVNKFIIMLGKCKKFQL